MIPVPQGISPDLLITLETKKKTKKTYIHINIFFFLLRKTSKIKNENAITSSYFNKILDEDKRSCENEIFEFCVDLISHMRLFKKSLRKINYFKIIYFNSERYSTN